MRKGWSVSYDRWAFGKTQGGDNAMFKTQEDAEAFRRKPHRNKRNLQTPKYVTEYTNGISWRG